jgi:hypothetical protein
MNWLEKATQFFMGKSKKHYFNGNPANGREVYISRMPGIDDEGKEIIRWAVRMDHGWVLGKDGRFHYEPQPSSRTDEFIQNCRYTSKEEAFEYWQKYENSELIKELSV